MHLGLRSYGLETAQSICLVVTTFLVCGCGFSKLWLDKINLIALTSSLVIVF